MAVGYNPRTVTDGLVLSLDAGNPKNYNIGISTNWTDKVGGNNGTLVGGTHHTDGPFVGAGYVEFDGTGDYLSIADNADFDLGSGDFTIEGWFNIQSGNFSGAGWISQWNSGLAWYFGTTDVSGANKFVFGYSTDGSGITIINSGHVVTNSLNEWVHYAVSKSGTDVRLFVNGTQQGSTGTLSGTIYNSSDNIIIGLNEGAGSAWYFNGNMSNVRVIKGTALYTSNFTPPTAPLTAVTNTVLLTCRGNTIADASSSAHTITANGDASARLGSPASAYEFDGTDDYIDLAQTIQFDTSDFSISGWFRSNSGNTSYKQIWNSGYNGGTPDVEIVVNQTNNQLSFYVRPPGLSATTTYSVDDNVWRYFTATKTSSEISLYVNGSLVDSTSGSFTSDVDIAGVIPRIGNGLAGTSNRPFKGNIAQIAVYNRALTAAEVQQNYNATKGRYLGG